LGKKEAPLGGAGLLGSSGGTFDGPGEDNPPQEIILRLGVERCPITKEQSMSAFCRTFAQFGPSHREIRCAGKMREDGGSLAFMARLLLL
jgi:hypothetical protein